jgi:hypothetical protein
MLGSKQDKTKKDRIIPYMEWNLKGQSITKGQLIILDIINQNHWKRPLYFCSTSGEENYLGLDDYLREDGITVRIVPLKKEKDTSNYVSSFPVNLDYMYNNVMHKFRWGNVNTGIHIDDQTNSFADSFKDVFIDLASTLYSKHKKDSCLAVLEYENKVLPHDLPPLFDLLGEAEFRNQHRAYLYFHCGKPQKGIEILTQQLQKIKENIQFMHSQGKYYQSYYHQTYVSAQSILSSMEKIANEQKAFTLIPKIRLCQNILQLDI